MKVGEFKVVSIEGQAVAQASITDIDTEAQTVTLVVPATKVVMSYTTQITSPPPAPAPEQLNDNSHVLLGTEDAAPGGTLSGVQAPEGASEATPVLPPGVPTPATEAVVNSGGTPTPPVNNDTTTGVVATSDEAVASANNLPQGVLPGEDPSA